MARSNNIIRTLSKMGTCSRKQALEFVRQNRIKINGQIVSEPGRQVKINDTITLDEMPVSKTKKIYIILNKPRGFVTTRKDELGRKTVYDLLISIKDWVSPVGRLDKDSEGLLLFTNDSYFSDYLTDPDCKIPRTYEVLIDGVLSQKDLDKIRNGTYIGRGESTLPAKIRVIKADNTSTFLNITLIEGKNREIRRLFESLGMKVKKLVRIQFGPFLLNNVPLGKWKKLDNNEVTDLIKKLKQIA